MNICSTKLYVIKKREGKFLDGILLVVFSFFALALGFSYTGQQKASLKLYPFNTFALESLMLEEMDGTVAETINVRNGMLASAHECAARSRLEDQQYEKAFQEICDMLTCAGYDSYYYNQAVYYLSVCLDQAVKSEDLSGSRMILEKIQEIPGIIKQKEEQASKLAYRINDKPEIELEEEIKNYIDQLSGVSL